MAQIADLLPQGTVLVTGSVRAPDLPPNARITRAYNSIYVIDHDGNVVSLYDKLHLVPFGEYLPFQGLLEKLGLEQLTKVQGGFIPGTIRRSGDFVSTSESLMPIQSHIVIILIIFYQSPKQFTLGYARVGLR